MEEETKVSTKITSYTDLLVWQEARKLATLIYEILKQSPHNEQYGLSSQMKRAVVSVPSNIAEGFGRQSAKEKNQFYYISKGSLAELETQGYIAFDVGLLPKVDLERLLTQATKTHKLLQGLIKVNKEHL